MTASLPVPQDAYSGEPDDVPASARAESGRVVGLPPKPRISAEEAANAAEPMDAAPPVPKRPARAPRQTPRTPRAKPRPRARPAAAPVADPGPPPPLPVDLAAGIVVPPRPPLPPIEPTAEPETAADIVVEPVAVIEPEIAAEPEVVESELDAGPEVVAESAIATQPAAEAIVEPELEPEVVHEPEPAAEPVVEVDPVTETLVEPEPQPGPEVVDEAPIESEVVDEAPVEAEPTAEAVVEPGVVDEPEPEEGIEIEPTASTVEEAPDLALAEIEHPSGPEDHVVAHGDAGAVAMVFEDEDEDEDDRLDETAPDVATPALAVRGVTKSFGETRAVDGIDLTVPAGTFYGLVGPNGAGKTTTLSMIAGLLRPTRGAITVNGIDATRDPVGAKRMMGVLPDRLRTFDRLTGRQLLYYYGVLRGLPPAVVEKRTADLARAFDLTDALGRVVSDYSAGMTKKVMLAGAMIHSPRLLVLDEPFEAVDPVSSAIILDILGTYVAHGGTVILSSHGMDLVERVCSRVAVIVAGQVLAEGTIDEVRGELTLEQRFIELAGGLSDVEGLEWLHTFSD